jgi:tetratricopeptide (TPR) repeat protein
VTTDALKPLLGCGIKYFSLLPPVGAAGALPPLVKCADKGWQCNCHPNESRTATNSRGFALFRTATGGRGFAWLLAALFLSLALHPANGAEPPLLEQDPYDTIRFDAANNHAEVRVEPLKFPNRKIPDSPKPTDKIDIQLLDEPEKSGPVEWRHIEKIILFEDRVLAKANELVAAEKLDEAYDYFKYLFDRYPNIAGLNDGYENYLYEEAKLSQRNQKFDESLALLRQLFAVDPKRQGLDKALGLATDKLVEHYAAQNRFAAARILIRDLAEAFPGHPVAAAWSERIGKQSDAYLSEARSAAQKGDWSKASEQCRQLAAVWPALPGAKELAEEIHQKYPLIAVGVMSAPQTGGENALADWSLRRDRRLFYRTLTEYLGPGMEGGRYLCPVGKCTLDAESLGRRLLVQIKPDIRWAGGAAELTSYDVSRRLWAMADPADPAFSEDWAELLEGTALKGVADLEVALRRPHVRPEALLQIRLAPYGESLAAAKFVPPNGPFLLPLSATAGLPGSAGNTDDQALRGSRAPFAVPPPSDIFMETVFRANPQYFAARPAQPKELIVRHYPIGANAIRALKRGEIQLLDRVAPWNLPSLKNDPKITVGKYGVPLVHCLVPNFRRQPTANRVFRRALAYGLNRDAILAQIVGKEPVEGCRVVSGPFPAGLSNDDPLNYAYDERIESRPCEPRMAAALAALSLKAFKDAEKEQGREVKKLPRLVLAHPDNEIAKTACDSIRYQLNLVHIEVDLKPIKGPMPDRVPDDVDLLYAELAMGEPATDAARLLGESGLAGEGSPYVALAVKQLESAADWASIRAQLRRLHRIVFDDVTVVPLWQLIDFYAYRKGNRGIGDKPFTIYQNIEQWQPAFSYPDGE